jgi:hypothetical protein
MEQFSNDGRPRRRASMLLFDMLCLTHKFRTGSEHRLLALQFAFEAFLNCAARIAQKSRSFCAEPLL